MTRIRALLSLFDPFWLAARLSRYAPLPIRFIVGYGFIAHGYAKLIKNPDNFVAILHALHVPAPYLMAWATILIELLGGFAILIGAFVPLVAIPMTAVLLVATLTVHLPYGFTSIKLMSVIGGVPQFGPPGYETDALYLFALATLLCGGAGPFSVDSMLARTYRRIAGGASGR